MDGPILTNDGTYSYQYDAEGRLTKVLQGSNTVSTMTYDAFGQQVQRVTPSVTYDLPYEPNGRTTGFFNEGTGAWEEQQFWGGGRLLGFYDGGNTYFLHRSEVGSLAPTQITDEADSLKGDETFYPYGQEWNYSNQTNGGWQFYGSISRYESDLGLYLTPNRFYPPAEGRWLSPDPLGGDVADPQSLNRYAYVTNNPASFNDPLGLSHPTACWTFPGGGWRILPGCEIAYGEGGGGGLWDTNPADLCSDPSYAISNTECGGPIGLPSMTPWGGFPLLPWGGDDDF